MALCRLLDAARAMAPRDAEARERRRRALAARDHERQQWRAQCRRLVAAGLDLDLVRAELDSFSATNDPRRAKFEAWVSETQPGPSASNS